VGGASRSSSSGSVAREQVLGVEAAAQSGDGVELVEADRRKPVSGL
jgi:hypothetical protein